MRVRLMPAARDFGQCAKSSRAARFAPAIIDLMTLGEPERGWSGTAAPIPHSLPPVRLEPPGRRTAGLARDKLGRVC